MYNFMSTSGKEDNIGFLITILHWHLSQGWICLAASKQLKSVCWKQDYDSSDQAIVPLSSSFVHVPIVAPFGNGQVSAWTL